MSNEDDFIMITNPSPEGQKIDVDIPLMEMSETTHFPDIYQNYLRHYQEYLGKKTLILYTDTSSPNFCTVYSDMGNYEGYSHGLAIINAFDPTIKFKIMEFRRILQVYKEDNSNLPRIYYGEWRSRSLKCFMNVMIDYNNWNVVMITGNIEKAEYHVDRIFRPQHS